LNEFICLNQSKEELNTTVKLLASKRLMQHLFGTMQFVEYLLEHPNQQKNKNSALVSFKYTAKLILF